MKKLFAAFIDYRKAFDNAWRVGLWQKLEAHNINDKLLNMIRSFTGRSNLVSKL